MGRFTLGGLGYSRVRRPFQNFSPWPSPFTLLAFLHILISQRRIINTQLWRPFQLCTTFHSFRPCCAVRRDYPNLVVPR
jgi:hypothetical protein